MTLDDLYGDTSFYQKFVSLFCWHSWKVLKRLGFKKKYIVEKDDLKL